MGIDFFPALNAMTVAAKPDKKTIFGTFEAPEPRSRPKLKAIRDDVRAALLPYANRPMLVVIGQSYAGIGEDDVYPEIEKVADEVGQSVLVRHNKLVLHFNQLHTMSRTEFIMVHMGRSPGDRLGEVYAEMLRRYGVETTSTLRSVS